MVLASNERNSDFQSFPLAHSASFFTYSSSLTPSPSSPRATLCSPFASSSRTLSPGAALASLPFPRPLPCQYVSSRVHTHITSKGMDQKLAPLVSSGVRQAEGMVSSVLKEEASRGALPSQTSSLAGSLQAFTESVVATALSNAGVRSFTGGYLATMIQLRDTIAASLVSAPRPTSADAPRPDSTMADPPADPLDHANLIIVKACEKREKAEPSKGLSLEVLKALRDYDEDSPGQ